MLETTSPLKMNEIAPRFASLLQKAETSLEHPSLDATWRAFAAFCQEPLDCDDERLFFEAAPSTSQPDSFYVHFSRTCYGREPKGHVWSHEVIGDFLFPLDDVLAGFNCTIEVDEITAASGERDEFLAEVQGEKTLWQALAERQAKQGHVYIGES